MPQRMHRSALVNATLLQRRLEHNLHAADGQWLGCLMHVGAAASRCWEQPRRVAMRFPKLAQQVQRRLGQGNIAVFGALAPLDTLSHGACRF